MDEAKKKKKNTSNFTETKLSHALDEKRRWKMKRKKKSGPGSTTLNSTGRALLREVKREGAGMTRPRLSGEGVCGWVGSQ